MGQKLEKALTTYLKADTGIQNLISDRIYFDETPQSVDLRSQSAIVIRSVSDIKSHVLQGSFLLDSPIYQFTAYAKTRLAALGIAEKVKAALEDYSGLMGSEQIQWIKLINELPDTVATPDGTVRLNVVTLEFEINHVRSD